MKLTAPSAIIIIALAAIITLSGVSDSIAQMPRAIERSGREYINFGNDMVSYRITSYEDDKEYVTYCRAVREKIRQGLKGSYRNYFKEGDVELLFLIRSDGKLLKFEVDPKRSTRDSKLIDITVSSLKKSSPFPPFPKELDASELPFFVTISFREKEVL